MEKYFFHFGFENLSSQNTPSNRFFDPLCVSSCNNRNTELILMTGSLHE